MSDLKGLLRKRGAIRGTITKTTGKIDVLLRDTQQSAISDQHLTDAETYLQLLTDKVEKLEELDEEIVELIDDDKLQQEQDEAYEYEVSTKKYINQLKRIESKRQSSKPKEVTVAQVKLPKRQVPKFSGNMADWQSFWDQFESSIHSNSSLANIDKFNYLLDALSQSAKSCIRGLSVTSDNYSTAIQLLQERFDNKELIVKTLMHQLSGLRLTDATLSNLRQFHDDIAAAVRSLEAQEVEANSFEALLIPTLMKNCHSAVRLELIRSASNRQMTIDSVDNLLEVLKGEITVRESAEHLASDSQKEIKTSSLKPSAAALVTQQQKPSPSSTEPLSHVFCTFCKGNHASGKCDKVTSIAGRREIIKSENRCFRCLRKGHSAKSCTDNRKCRQCNGNHHVSICSANLQMDSTSKVERASTGNPPQSMTKKPEASASNQCLAAHLDNNASAAVVGTAEQQSHSAPKDSNPGLSAFQAVTLFLSGNPAVALPAAKAIILSPDGRSELMVRVLLDTASNRSYIREDVCSALGIQGEETEDLTVSTFSGMKSTAKSARVNFRIRKMDSFSTVVLSASVVPNICQPQPSVISHTFDHLKELDLADPYDPRDKHTDISILIGSDQYYQLVQDHVIRGKAGPVAIESKLGYLLCGPITIDEDQGAEDLCHSQSHSSQTLCCFTQSPVLQFASADHRHDQLWSLETIGIHDSPSAKAKDEYPCNPKFEGDRYSVTLPWLYEKSSITLEDHLNLSLRRLNSSMRKINSTPDLRSQCDTIISDQLEKGIIERVPEQHETTSIIHYLPHSCVIKKDSEVHEETGITTIPNIAHILMRFRLGSVPIIADIEKAFLQVSIDKSGRDSLRFLWPSNGDGGPDQITHYRFCRLPFGLTCSPAILNAVISHHLTKEAETFSDIVQRLANDLYVDNFITSCGTVEEAHTIRLRCKELFHRASMNMRQWQSSSEEFNAAIPDEDSGSGSKVLGMHWLADEDKFELEFKELATSTLAQVVTKRVILSLISRIFDPLGLISPAVTMLKIWFQKLCVAKVQWDDPIVEGLEAEVQKWLRSLAKFQVRVPRYVGSEACVSSEQVQLHGFCDASEQAYAAVIYIRVHNRRRDKVITSLLLAKTRVAPLTTTSIARLELLGALILARLMAFVSEKLPFTRRLLWTDSMNALCWITRDTTLRQVFIQNRVKEIRRLTNIEEWRHVPGDQNPADLPSRGCLPHQLQNNRMWFQGPEFLLSDEFINTEADSQHSPVSSSVDIIAHSQSDETALPVQAHHSEDPSISKIVKVENYSSWTRLLRVTAWVRRFASNLQRKLRGQPVKIGMLDSEELRHSEKLLLYQEQVDNLPDEFQHLLHAGSSTALSRDLRLFVDQDGLLRCHGRLGNSVPVQSNHPVLVPRHSPVENLLIRHCHKAVGHGGVQDTLCKLRETYWILKGRQKVKSVLLKCVICKRVQGRPFTVSKVADLPPVRTQSSRPFLTVGLDCAGPIFYRTGEEREDAKGYIVLFTCTATRAIHLELVTSMDSKQFINALRRFVARRGIPSIISDNAKTLRSAANQIGAQISEDLKAFCAEKRIAWNFIPEKAPWWGGFWERMVGLVKTSLKKVMGRSLLNYDDLYSTVVEVESLINSRPLLYVSSGEEREVITPAHFLVAGRLTKESRVDLEQDHMLPLPTRLRLLRSLVNQFWDTWSSSYLQSLREKSVRTQSQGRKPRVGEVVLITGEPRQSRLMWKMGIIKEIRNGRDGEARAAIVRVTGARDTRWETIRRPIQALVPLEIDSDLSGS